MSQYFKCLFLVGFISISFGVDAARKADNRAAAIIDNYIITNQQVIDKIEDKLYEAELKVYELKFNQVKSMLLQRLVESHPLNQGMQPQAFLDKYVLKNPTVSEQEIDQLIKNNRISADKINPEFRKKAGDYIIGEKSRLALDNWFKAQSKEHDIIINLQKPERPRFEVSIGNAPVSGNENAVVTIVEYSDFQCPYCARAEATIKQLQKNYSGKIKLVYKQFPLDFHDNAFKASEASLCANDQSTEYFWRLHDHMLANIRKLSTAELIAQAKTLGMDQQKFSQCLSSGQFASQVNKEIAEGQKLGVQATPMFFVNGISVRGARPYKVFAEIIEDEINRELKN